MTRTTYTMRAVGMACIGMLLSSGMAFAVDDCKNLTKDCTASEAGNQRECKNDKGRIVCQVCTKGLHHTPPSYHWRMLNDGKCFDDMTPGDDPLDGLFNNF